MNICCVKNNFPDLIRFLYIFHQSVSVRSVHLNVQKQKIYPRIISVFTIMYNCISIQKIMIHNLYLMISANRCANCLYSPCIIIFIAYSYNKHVYLSVSPYVMYSIMPLVTTSPVYNIL